MKAGQRLGRWRDRLAQFGLVGFQLEQLALEPTAFEGLASYSPSSFFVVGCRLGLMLGPTEELLPE
jgi:hypothetical protein